MPLTVKRWSVLAFVFAFLALSCSIAIAAVEWQVIKVSGHDYLSVDNISKFYGLLAEVVPSGAKIQTNTADHPLEFINGSREAVINGARSWLCFPVIEQDGKFLVTRTDVAKTIEPLVRPHRVPDVGKIQTVVLDAGHGGYDKGQMSRYGAEKDFALDVARKLRLILQAKGFRVIMTREGDYFVPLEVRAKIANSARNSITPRGAPSTSDGNVTLRSFNMQPGSSVDARSMALSACIYHSVLGQLREYDRGIKRARFAVLRLTTVPAVLIECGFLTERGESKLISDKDWRAKLAGAIAIGIENYQELPVKKQPPMLVADYRRQAKSAPVDPITKEGGMKEADASLLELVGRSAFLSHPQPSTPAPTASLESAPIVP